MNNNSNIQVAIRVRPLIPSEIAKKEQELWTVKDGKYIFQKSSPSEKFCFDRVFDPEENNSVIYGECCLPIVKSVMQGFNGTVFAYGQTSSGKTYTMMGQYNGIYQGVIQFAISDIFDFIQEMPDREFLLRVSFMEIYNEKVYDLLSDKLEDLKVFEDCDGNIKVNGLQEEIVQTQEQVWKWMRIGQKKRHTGETQMNRNSSRSHSIFRMIIESRVKDEDATIVNVSQLNLVDLAGSENLKKTRGKGERFKEGVHINLSLSTLSQVISQLSEKEDQFIKYRNSKLTRLLQNSLGGNALTAIICAVTPASLKETLSTLQFAQRAKKIQNKPTVNEILTDQALLKQYANKIKKLSQELQASKEQGKELEEKTKQNEKLKRQIEALKANFVSQTTVSKSSRRETWGGRLYARHMRPPALSFPSRPPTQSPFDLSCLEEETEGDIDASDFGSSRYSVLKSVSEAETQTELENDNHDKLSLFSPGSYHRLKNELGELQEFTTLELQHIRAENELEREIEDLKSCIEDLRQQNEDLKNKLTNLESAHSMQITNLEENFEKKLAEDIEVFREAKNNEIKDVTYLQEKYIKSEICNRKLREEVENLGLQIEDMEAKFKSVQSECSAKSILPQEFEVKYNELLSITAGLDLSNLKYLQEKYNESQECDRELRQKIIDLEASYCSQIETLKAKFETTQTEYCTQLHLFAELEEKYNKLEAMTAGLDLNNLKCLQEKYIESEKCNEVLRQNIADLKASNDSKIEELSSKLTSVELECSTKSCAFKELEAKYNELKSVTADFDLSHLNFLQEKCKELERHNEELNQKVSDFNANSSSGVVEKLETKLKIIQSENNAKSLLIQELEAKCNKQLPVNSDLDLNLQSLQEKCKELDECKAELNLKLTELQTLQHSQKELEEKLEIALKECNSKSLTINELKINYESKLAELKNQIKEANCFGLEECKKDLTHKLLDLKINHQNEIEAAETKFKTSQSELAAKYMELEELHKELVEIRKKLKEAENQELLLRVKCNDLEQCNSDLRGKITDMETSHETVIKRLKEDYEADLEDERSEWSNKMLTLLNEQEKKYEQELNDQEVKLMENFKTMLNERITTHIAESCELKSEIKTLKLQNQELEEIKQNHLDLINKLRDSCSKYVEQISRIERDRDEKLLASMKKYEKAVLECKSRQRQCEAINQKLTTQKEQYMAEIEKLKSENKVVIQGDVSHLEEKISKLKNEKDIILKKYAASKTEISNLKDNISKLHKEVQNKEKMLKDSNNNEELEKNNRMLRFDLDQKKAKILTLETNNANMSQEITKLRERLSSKVASCQCKTGKEYKQEVQGSCNNKNDDRQRSDDQNVATPYEDVKKSGSSGDTQKEKENKEGEDPYLLGGGSGTANMVKCYWLQGLLQKREKDIRKLKEENAQLESELKAVKNRPVIFKENKPEVKRPPIKSMPTMVLHEINNYEDILEAKTPIQHQSVIPKVPVKQMLKDKKRRKSFKPYEGPVDSLKREGVQNQMKAEPKEIKTTDDLLGMMMHQGNQPSECKQQ